MKRILAIIVLNLFFIIPSQADDIKDFEIEGMSLGDSVLDHLNEKDFLQFKLLKNFKDNTYSARETRNKKLLKVYDSLQINYLSNDKKYKIYGLSGLINFKNDHKECMLKQKEVVNELQLLFPQSKLMGPRKKNFQKGHSQGYWEGYAFKLVKGDLAIITCYNYKKKDMIDHLRISIRYKAYNDFLNNRAYK